MKIKQIIESSTTAGSVATVPFAMNGMQTRNPSIYGQKKVGNLFKGKKTSKPYVNSINESAELSEEELSEEDLILVPGHGRNSKGFISKASDRTDREVEMAKGDLYQSIKNAKMIFDMLGDVSEEDGIEGWVQEKIIKASDYLNTVREYMEQQRFANEMTGGVIAGGMANESAKKKVNPYAVGMAQAMKSTGDKPPLKKSTIVKGHEIAKKIKG